MAMVAALALIWFLQPSVSQWLGNSPNPSSSPNTAVKPQQPPPAMPDGSTTASPFTPGTDPFKVHLEKNGASPGLAPLASLGAQSNATSQGSVGTDPFRAFLDKEKQMGQGVGISPFGK